MLNVIVLSSLLGVVFIAFVVPATRLQYAFLASAILVGVWLAVRRGYVRAAALAIVVGVAFILAVSTFTGGGVRNAGFGGFTIVILFAGLLVGSKAAIGVTIFCVFYGLYLYAAGSYGWLPNRHASETATYWIVGSVYFILTGVMLTLALRMIEGALQKAKLESDARKRTSEQYHALFDNSPIGIYRSSVDGRMIEANQALTRFNGYENKDEFLETVADIATEWYVVPGRREDFKRELEAHGQVINFESEVYRHKTRERVWISENARIVRDAAGKILYYEGTVEEITPRKQAENELDFLYNLGIALARSEDLVGALVTLQTEALKLIPADALFVAMYDESADRLEYPVFFMGGESQQYPAHRLNDRPGLTEAVILSGKTLYLKDMLADHVQDQLSFMGENDGALRTFLGIPLTVDEKVIGAFSVQSKKVDAYSTDQIRFLENMAFQAALAIDKLRLLERVRRELQERRKVEGDLRLRAEEMSLLYQISQVLMSGEDLYHTLRDFVKELKRVMVVDAFHVGFYDAHTDLFTYSLFLNLDEDLQVPPRSLRENPGLTGEVISNKRTIYLPDVADEQARQGHRIVTVKEAGIRSYIGIPLMLQDRVIGVMSVQALQAHAYSPDHIRLLETLAAQVASTVEKSRLLDQLRQELDERAKIETSLRQRETMLEAVTFAAEQFLKTSDWRVNIDIVLENLGKTINASHCYLFEHHTGADGQELSSLRYEWAAPGFTNSMTNPVFQAHPVRSESGTTDEILQRGESLAASIATFPPAERKRLNDLGVRALMESPVLVDGRWWGTIGVDDMTKERDWSTSEADVMRAAANVLGAAIKRQLDEASLQNELNERRQVEVNLRQREAILAVVAEAANRLLKAPDWRSEISPILENLGEVINATHAYLFENQLKEDGTPATSIRFEWTAPEYPTDLGTRLYQNIALNEPDFGAWYEALSAGLPFIGDRQRLAENDLRLLRARGMQALLDVPIFVDGEWWGIIGFDDMERARVWSNAEADALLSAANMLGTAIERRKADQLLQEELTHRKQLIAELAAKNAELERFTYTVSHDLKSPLFTIRGFLGYLEKDLLDGNHTRFRADAKRIAEATEKMQQLLNDLLELSRVGRLMNEPVEIQMNEIVHDVLSLVDGQIQERGVVVQVQEDLPRVYADRQRIAEVVQNLVDNAVKFVSVQPNPRIEIGRAGEEHGMPILFVRDNGIGIASEHFERVFGLFNKLDPRSEGTGIGLALVKRIVEFHGGRIWIESELGEGATFYFTLPTAAVASPPRGADVNGV
ncbi:MAG: GAF domain-containing protein [Anaerolineales bacterium]|nr:GAF domain-containing protein [Anaerolineales bacterium]